MQEFKMIKPQLCTDIPEDDALRRFSRPDVTGELKLDGVRTLIDITEEHGMIAYARTGRQFQHLFEMERMATQIGLYNDCLLDGELITGEGKIADFPWVNGRVKITKYHKAVISAKDYPIRFVAFDILRWQGKDVSQMDWIDRHNLLKEVWLASHKAFDMPYSGTLAEVVAYAHANGYEGVIVKEHYQKYRFGKRDWNRIKFTWELEVIAIAKTKPTGTRINFGALTLSNGCNVGQGFTNKELVDLDVIPMPFNIVIKHYGILSEHMYRNPVYLRTV